MGNEKDFWEWIPKKFFLSTKVSIEHAPERGNCLHPTTLRLMFAKTCENMGWIPCSSSFRISSLAWRMSIYIIINASTIPTIHIVQLWPTTPAGHCNFILPTCAMDWLLFSAFDADPRRQHLSCVVCAIQFYGCQHHQHQVYLCIRCFMSIKSFPWFKRVLSRMRSTSKSPTNSAG